MYVASFETFGSGSFGGPLGGPVGFGGPLGVRWVLEVLCTQEADGLVYAYILIWVAKSCGRSATGFEGVFLGFYI